ncbi:MAG: hypothetical protein K6E12_01235 [Saccharofermentans sp.]|nr:hypothetical protein [Saccharofermentans sp.]
MKIKSIKNYKKPLYAVGLSTAIMAVALTGCTDPAIAETETTTVELQEVIETITAGIVYIHTK